jgi:hypothetical protein
MLYLSVTKSKIGQVRLAGLVERTSGVDHNRISWLFRPGDDDPR